MALKYIGERAVGTLNGMRDGFVKDDLYRVFDSGILMPGGVSVNHGDFVSWDGTKWVNERDIKIATNELVSESTANFAPEYSATSTYSAGSYVVHDGTLYTNPNAIGTAEAWTPAHWTQTTIAQMMAGFKIEYTTKNLATMIGGNYHIPVKNRECVNIEEIGYSGVSEQNRHLTIELENDCTDSVINILRISLASMKGLHWTFEVTRGNITLPIYGFSNKVAFTISTTETAPNILTSENDGGSGYEVPESFDDTGLTTVIESCSMNSHPLTSLGDCAICLEVKGDVVIVHQINGTSF